MEFNDSDNCWICKYSFESVHPNGDYDCIVREVIVNQEEKPSYSQVKKFFLNELPSGFTWDRNFKLISIDPMKISRFKLALSVNPIHDEKIRYGVIKVDNNNNVNLDAVYESYDDACKFSLYINRTQEAREGKLHAFVRKIKYSKHQVDDNEI